MAEVGPNLSSVQTSSVHHVKEAGVSRTGVGDAAVGRWCGTGLDPQCETAAVVCAAPPQILFLSLRAAIVCHICVQT